MNINRLAFKTIEKIVNKITVFVITSLSKTEFFSFMQDQVYLEFMDRILTGFKLNINEPISYNEKLQYLKLNNKMDLTDFVDKLQVRKYIEDTIGEQYLVKLLGVYEKFDEIVFEDLPNSFVIKTTHGSGSNIICKDKSKLNKKVAKKKIESWLKRNWFWFGRVYAYKSIKPQIIIEEYLSDDYGNEPMDFKFFCFHGEPKLIQLDINRFGEHKQNFYDIDWNFRKARIRHEFDSKIQNNKPKNFENMVAICRLLSKQFIHVRVDLYNVNGQIKFGELTFYSLSGFGKYKDEWLNQEMGSWIDLETLNQ